MTVPGEALFERFCDSLSLEYGRIAEASQDREKRPDYRVVGHDGTQFVAEVKLITPTQEEARDIARVFAGEIFATGGTPGERVRRLIGKANQQLKTIASDSPGVLAILNPEFLLRRHTDPYAILTAMRGLDVVDVAVPRDPALQPRFGPPRSGPRKKMTNETNTSTSAIVCPVETDGGWEASIYHNRFARIPLPVSAIQRTGVTHWRVGADERGWEAFGA